MDHAGIPALVEAIAHTHGLAAEWIETVHVDERLGDAMIWEGDVEVFAIEHPKAERAYAWSLSVPGTERRRFFAVLGVGPIKSAVDAVRVAIAAHAHGKT